jgi:hypothetical protein
LAEEVPGDRRGLVRQYLKILAGNENTHIQALARALEEHATPAPATEKDHGLIELAQTDSLARYDLALQWKGLIELALGAFVLDCHRYPTTEEGLGALVQDPGVSGWRGPYWKRELSGILARFRYSIRDHFEQDDPVPGAKAET